MFMHDLPGEIWEPVSGHENYYEVSNYGRVKSLAREVALNLNPSFFHVIPAKILSQRIQKNKYADVLRIEFCVNSVKSSFAVKELVYHIFIEKIDLKKYEVIHLDGDGKNCMADNLGKRLRCLKDRKQEAMYNKWKEQGWANPDIPYQNMSLEDMDGEIWKPLLHYEPYYLISNLGRVKSLARKAERMLNGGKKNYEIEEFIRKQVLDTRRTPNLTFTVNIDCTRREFKTAHAVYSTFTGSFDFKGYKIVHRDEDPLNNHVRNLFLEKRKRKRKRKKRIK
jgi:hypothetical protein